MNRKLELGLLSPEVYAVGEPLSDTSLLKLERVRQTELGMAGAVAHWGRKYPREEVERIITEQFGPEYLAEDTGFSEIYRVPENFTPEEIFAEEISVIQKIIAAALELNRWRPEQVDALYFAGSPLVLPNYGSFIAQETNLSHLAPETGIFNYYLACNAGGRALKDALTHPEFQGKNVLVLAVEGLTRQTLGFDAQKADPLSYQLFSDGAAIIGLVPGETLTYLLGRSKTVRDPGALAAVEPYQQLVDQTNEEVVQVRGNTTLIRLPSPPEGKQIWMKGWETTKLFVNNVATVIAQVYSQYQEQYPEREIEMIVTHHASAGVNQLLQRKLEKIGVTLPIPWVITEGNSSGATTLMAFVRLLKDMQPGDHVMVASFGAGISIDVFVVEIGQEKDSD